MLNSFSVVDSIRPSASAVVLICPLGGSVEAWFAVSEVRHRVALCCLASPALAQESLFPVIDVEVSAEAKVERHPTIREGMVEVVVRGCYQDLGAVLTGRTNLMLAAWMRRIVGPVCGL